MRRREFITLIGSAAGLWPLCAGAQQTSNKTALVGVLWHAASAEEEDVYLQVLLKAFHDLGYVEGKTIRLDQRFPAEDPQRFRQLAQELVDEKPDVIIAVTNFGAVELKRATSTIPIVVALCRTPRMTPCRAHAHARAREIVEEFRLWFPLVDDALVRVPWSTPAPRLTVNARTEHQAETECSWLVADDRNPVWHCGSLILSRPDARHVQCRLEPRPFVFHVYRGQCGIGPLYADPTDPEGKFFNLFLARGGKNCLPGGCDRRFVPLLRGSVMTSGASL